MGTISTIASIFFTVTGAPVLASALAANAAIMNTIAGATQKKPAARGSTSNVLIGSNMPQPYSMGRTFVGGNLLHDVGYGGEVDDVKNPYRTLVLDWSCAGPAEEIEAFQADFTTVAFSGGNAVGYYHNWLYLDTQLGATPEAGALAGPFGAIPQWGAAYKMSGHCAGLITARFDKKAKVYASGLPQFGAILKGVWAYDPRLDSTYAGGSGPQRFDDESTWAWSDNPGVHGITYGRGRYQNSKKVFGCGFRETGIDLAAWVEFANVCDANGWTLGGTIYEPGSKWDNLKRICAAGAAEPVFVGGRLSVKFNAPRVGLDTITRDDLADGEIVIPAMKTWRQRLNGLIPRYRSEAHKWEYVQSDLVSVEAYVEEDGEEKSEERQIDLIQDKDQAAQVCAYELVNAREIGPIVIPCKPRLMGYVPGEAIYVDLPDDAGLDNQLCVITGRRVDPGTGIVELTLETETTAKHAFALGLTGTAPPTPSLTDGEELDDVAAGSNPGTSTSVVADEPAQLALMAVEGDVAVRTDLGATFIHNGGTAGTIADWTELPAASDVTSVNGETGAVVLSAGDIGSTATGGVDATNVQAAIAELESEKLAASAVSAFGQTLIDDADATTARATLGLVIGTNVQAQDAQLAAVAGLTPAADQIIYWTGTTAAAMTSLTSFARTLIDDADAATMRATLGLVIGTNVQAQDAELAAIAALTSAADRLPYFTGSGTASLATFTAAGRTMAGAADAAAQRSALALGSAALVAVGTSGATLGLLNTANIYSARQDVASTLRASGASAPATGVGIELGYDGTNGFVLSYDRTGSAYRPMLITGLTFSFRVSGLEKLGVNSTGIDVTGEARCDTLRIDATPTAATPTPTHTVPININGTVYRFPCVI